MKADDYFISNVSLWLHKKFINFYIVSDLYLIGSTLKLDRDCINDVDIVQRLCKTDKNRLIEFNIIVKETKREFVKEFNLPLHITTFTDNEKDEFVTFMSKNISIKII